MTGVFSTLCEEIYSEGEFSYPLYFYDMKTEKELILNNVNELKNLYTNKILIQNLVKILYQRTIRNYPKINSLRLSYMYHLFYSMKNINNTII